MSGFRLSAKRLALTYSQTPQAVSKNWVHRELVTELARKGHTLASYIVGMESHKDGGKHFHVYLELTRKANFRNGNVLDLTWIQPDGSGQQVLHPNLKACDKGWVAYCKKDGDFIGEASDGKAEDYIALARAGDYRGAESAFASAHPRDYAINLQRIRKNLRLMSGTARAGGKMGPWQRCFSGLTAWKRDCHLLVLTGGTGVGKTQWALAQGTNPLLVRHLDQLRSLDASHDLIVLDDMSFAHIPREAAIHLCDMEEPSPVHIRYGIAILPARMPRILTTNLRFESVFPQDDEGAIERRVFVWNLDEH